MQSVLERATSLHKQGRLAEAAPLYRQALAAAPGDPRIEYLLAALLYQQGDGAAALAGVNAALQKMPGLAEALMLRGAIAQQDDHHAALKDFQAVTAQQPGHGDAWYNQGVLLAQLGRNPEAINAFDRALQVRPGAAIWNNRGTALLAIGRNEDALASFSQALALDPGYMAALYNRATALLQLQRPQQALADFELYLARVPDAFEAWNNRGAALQALGRHELALESYRRAAAMRPEFAPAWKNSGLVLKALERYAEAAQAFGRAGALSPGDAEIWSGQGEALSHIRRYDEAIASCETALALTPDDGNVWSQYAGILRANQRFDDALAALARALALAPENLQALETQAALLCERHRISEGLENYLRRAVLIYDGKPQQAADDPDHKKRHDAEQAAWLASMGVNADPDAYRIAGGARLAGRAVNPANGTAICAQWQSSQPEIVVIDDLLTPEALEALRQFCWGSSVWKKPYPHGYLGAMQEHGFAVPLLAQIADELRETFAAIFADHGLLRLWGFKYDSTQRGIRLHADQAMVNVNFWITPDSANRNPDNGGLVIWDKSAPLDWDFKRYTADEASARAFLAEAGAKPVTVPYRANRAVIFDSDLFHETDRIEFEEGYLNRRINITMLFGRRTFDGG